MASRKPASALPKVGAQLGALKLAPYGIPLNWIYEGKMANLPPHIRVKIREVRDRDA